MSQSICERSVILLDRSPSMATSGGIRIDMDSLSKSRAPGLIPLAPISKTLWTHAVEATLEYCRVVWDIFADTECQVRVLVNAVRPVPVNAWRSAGGGGAGGGSEQHLSALMASLPQAVAEADREPADASHSLHSGLQMALQCLLEPAAAAGGASDSPVSTDEAAGTTGAGRGRVLLVCQQQDEAEWRRLQRWFAELVTDTVARAARSRDHWPLCHCELSVVALLPAEPATGGAACLGQCVPVGRQLSSSVSWCRVDHQLLSCFIGLVLVHYQLASTIITGIPMKEEQNAGSSANYDVELLHPRSVMLTAVQADTASSSSATANPAPTPPSVSAGQGASSNAGTHRLYDSVTLRWCAPRGSSGDQHVQACSAAARVTPLDVTGRPSCCLANFLLSGRAVMLEQARRCGTRHVSHMLLSHGGAIYMHTVAAGGGSGGGGGGGAGGRCQLDQVPAVEDGLGGRVSDYRTAEFVRQLIDGHRLCPPPTSPSNSSSSSSSTVSRERALERLQRSTRYWPMTAGATAALALPPVQQLLDLLVLSRLDTGQLAECRQLVMALVAMETRGEQLPAAAAAAAAAAVSTPGGRSATRQELFGAVWRELEQAARVHSTTSPDHQLVLQCVLECRVSADGGGGAAAAAAGGGGTGTPAGSVALEQAISALDGPPAGGGAGGCIDSPASPPPPVSAKRARSAASVAPSAGQCRSLLSAWSTGLQGGVALRRTEFIGRMTPTFKLYANLASGRDKNAAAGDKR